MTEQDYEQIEKEMLAADESHLWPVCNRINVTQYAIDLLADESFDDPESYRAAIDLVISDWVNNEENW
jgi:hypothetical protein